MSENIKQDLRKIAGDAMNTLKDGTELVIDVEGALAGNIIQGIKAVTSDVPKVIADSIDDIKDGVTAIHDILPNKKTKVILSNGEIIEKKYYEDDLAFSERIAKYEAHIKQFGNYGE